VVSTEIQGSLSNNYRISQKQVIDASREASMTCINISPYICYDFCPLNKTSSVTVKRLVNFLLGISLIRIEIREIVKSNFPE